MPERVALRIRRRRHDLPGRAGASRRVLVEPGSVPTTGSGKLQRARCVEFYLAEVRDLVG